MSIGQVQLNSVWSLASSLVFSMVVRLGETRIFSRSSSRVPAMPMPRLSMVIWSLFCSFDEWLDSSLDHDEEVIERVFGSS
jgi:hypothetical protein